MLEEQFEESPNDCLSYEQLIHIQSSPATMPGKKAFDDAMKLLREAHNNILRLRSQIRDLESDIGDYRAREASLDVLTLRSEVRALMARVNSLETTLKLQRVNDEKPQ